MRTYVAVSWVLMQVSMSSAPVFQSRRPCSWSSCRCGGIDEVPETVPAVAAPSMSEPPKKQTKWSCFGVKRQELIMDSRQCEFLFQEKRLRKSTYISPARFLSGMSSEVYVKWAYWLFLMRCSWTPLIASSYICSRTLSLFYSRMTGAQSNLRHDRRPQSYSDRI